MPTRDVDDLTHDVFEELVRLFADPSDATALEERLRDCRRLVRPHGDRRTRSGDYRVTDLVDPSTDPRLAGQKAPVPSADDPVLVREIFERGPLDDTDGRVLALVYFEDLTEAEAAERLVAAVGGQHTANSVGSRKRRALARLAAFVDKARERRSRSPALCPPAAGAAAAEGLGHVGEGNSDLAVG